MKDFIAYIHKNQFLGALLVVAIGWLLWQVKDILLALFIAYILMAGLSPYVDFLKRRRFPNVLAVVIPYFLTLALVVILIVPLVPFFVAQIQALFNSFPVYLDRAASIFGIQVNPEQTQQLVSEELGSISRNALSVTARVFGGFFSLLAILVVSFYLLLDHARIRKTLVTVFEFRDKQKAEKTVDKINEKLGGWLRGQIVLSVFIGSITWIVLTILGVPFALPLALIAGILEIIPTLGPLMASIPAIIIALNVSPNLALFVAIAYFAINQLENSILVPRIMEKAVGLHPVVIIIGVIIGGNLLGVVGALLSIPFISLVVVVAKSLSEPD